ncbi:MAG: histidine kinase, partial [Actinomycetota bacterium]|nr:histidine kinase [Actinomycetota bacterium]
GRVGEPVLAGIGAVLGAASVAAWSGGLEVAAAAAVLGGSLAFARRHPRAVWIVATAALLVTVPQGILGLATYVLVPAHAFCAGRWDSRWSGLAGAIALIVASELGVLVAGDAAVPYAFVPVAAWAAGRALREREQVVERLAVQARELHEEREAHARLSVRYERARIAAELHDIVAHAISVLVVQASAGQRLVGVDPELTAEAFAAIAAAAHEAEQDIARLVELLADSDSAGPGPDLAVIKELVTRAAGSGLRVTLRLEGQRDGLPAIVSQTAYRVVQEGLTNALRHASGAPVEVLVRGEQGELLIDVLNGPSSGAALLAGAGTGNGLLGVRERVTACGGTIEAGATPDGGWRLRARLSLTVTALRARQDAGSHPRE